MDVPDVCRSAILNNSPIKLFLSHDASDLDVVASTFKLNEREVELLRGLRSVPGRFSELLGLFGERRQVLRLVPTGIEYWLATSHPNDRKWEEFSIACNPKLSREEIVKGLAQRYPNGAIELQIRAA